MQIVHIVSQESGGAGRAAHRISEALRINGNKSTLLVLNHSGKGQTAGIYGDDSSWKLFKLKRKLHSVCHRQPLAGQFYFDDLGHDISGRQDIRNADIINIHWINDGMLNCSSLRKLTQLGKPMVWTMHDMFPFTAGCYYDQECHRYASGCNECPLANGNMRMLELIKRQYSKKEELYGCANISFVGCSRWITACARKSKLTASHLITNIPNPIDLEVFQRRDKESSKSMFGIKTKKRIILFGAMSSDSDRRKGYKFLHDAISLLNPENYLLVVFGNNGEVQIDDRFETVGIGRISGDEKLSSLYSIADVFVAPSIQENLSNAVMESLACGTPAVAFNIGGMPDMIIHKENGYIATPFHVEDLARGIDYCASGQMADSCRSYVVDHFSPQVVGKEYENLYFKLLHEAL